MPLYIADCTQEKTNCTLLVRRQKLPFSCEFCAYQHLCLIISNVILTRLAMHHPLVAASINQKQVAFVVALETLFLVCPGVRQTVLVDNVFMIALCSRFFLCIHKLYQKYLYCSSHNMNAEIAVCHNKNVKMLPWGKTQDLLLGYGPLIVACTNNSSCQQTH